MKVLAMVHSLKDLAEVEIIEHKDNNNVIAEYKDQKCTAIFNPSLIFKLCKCRKTSQPLCHYITNYVVVKTKMYVEDSLDNDIICDFVAN